MKYLCLFYHEEKRLAALTPAELDALTSTCGAWVEDLEQGGHYVLSAGLQSVRTAVTVRNRDGKMVVTDGPFAETREVLGGLTLIEARDLNEAIQLASKSSAARLGSIEVRPLLEPDADVSDPLDRKVMAAIRRKHVQEVR